MSRFNWHHFYKVLYTLGYKQISTRTSGFLYFEHPRMPRITIEKENKMSEERIGKYLAIMKLPRPFFEPVYKCATARDSRRKKQDL